MEKLRSLFVIYLLLITISFVIGGGVFLIFGKYAEMMTGMFLISSSVVVIFLFVDDLLSSPADGDEA